MARTPLWRSLKSKRWSTPTILRQFSMLYPPVDIFRFAKRMGIHVHVIPDPGWAGAVRSTEDRADIWIRQEDSYVRQRFTLAHEIGHLMLHPLGEEFRDVVFYPHGDEDKKDREAQANGYAAGLLMPFFMLERDVQRMSSLDVKGLAARYEVSEQAMQIRLNRMFENAAEQSFHRRA